MFDFSWRVSFFMRHPKHQHELDLAESAQTVAYQLIFSKTYVPYESLRGQD